MYVLQENNSACVLCSFSTALFFIGDKTAADSFKDGNTTSLKANGRIKFSQDVVLNHLREKGKPQFKLLYKVLKGKYWYYPLVDISPYQTLIQLKFFIGGIHHCVTVVGKWIFDSDFTFALPLTKGNLD